MKQDKKIIKMNNNNNYLSLGNFCRLIKEISPNKSITNQTDVFCTLFDLEEVNDSTINNYCLGYRSIGEQYKQILEKKKTKYQKDKKIMLNIISNLTSILNGSLPIGEKKTINNINQDINLNILCNNLYNIAKNDTNINKIFLDNITNNLEQEDLYSCINEFIFYIILEHKQPIYIENIIKETIEELTNKTDISLNDLASFIQLQTKEEVNYIYSLKKLAKSENAYAAFELGLLEYSGKINGTPRYQNSYQYFKIAADKKHPRANYFIAKMFFEGKLGTLTKEDINKSLEYALIAEKHGNIPASNLIGLIYLNNKNDKEKAIYYFEKASNNNYPYAYNNLGKLKEQEKVYQKAFEYYEKSSELEESWACNKIAEYYRQGIGTKKNQKKAFEYYNLALESPNSYNTSWPKYNLAIYFYLNGNYQANIEKDETKAIKLLKESANSNNIESITFLIEYYTETYFKERNRHYLQIIYNYITKLEKHPNYSIEYKKQVENIIKKIKNKKEIKVNLQS